MDPKILLNYINMRLDSTPLTLNAIFQILMRNINNGNKANLNLKI